MYYKNFWILVNFAFCLFILLFGIIALIESFKYLKLKKAIDSYFQNKKKRVMIMI